jgi:hypothetical protein
MPVTRQQAQLLLSASEMELYDESRSNPLRKLDATALQKRIDRIRRSRERARDLVQRQKLASRASTGSKLGHSGMANQRSKEKAALIDDILKRFEGALQAATGEPAVKVARPAPAPSPAAPRRRKPKAKKPIARVLSHATPGHAAGESAGAGGKAPARKPSARDVAAKKRIQAARTSNRLLGKKPARDRPTRSWDALDSAGAPGFDDPGFRASGSAGKPRRPHAGQARTRPAQDGTGTRGKRSHGKRDFRSRDA